MVSRANRFRAMRKARMLTQQQAARIAGLAQSVISDLETETSTNPTWDVLGRLIQVYACGCTDLLPLPKLPNHRRGSK